MSSDHRDMSSRLGQGSVAAVLVSSSLEKDIVVVVVVVVASMLGRMALGGSPGRTGRRSSQRCQPCRPRRRSYSYRPVAGYVMNNQWAVDPKPCCQGHAVESAGVKGGSEETRLGRADGYVAAAARNRRRTGPVDVLAGEIARGESCNIADAGDTGVVDIGDAEARKKRRRQEAGARPCRLLNNRNPKNTGPDAPCRVCTYEVMSSE
jgi:hypothetical protein